MEAPKPKDSRTWVTVTIVVAVIGCIGALGAALINALPDIIRSTSSAQSAPTVVSVQNSVSVPTNASIANTSSDKRDVAAQTLGYANLDAFMQAFGIPAEIKPRIFVCPNEETWCLGVYEEPGQLDFHFKNITNCTLDGKQVNGESVIPVGFDGMVKGFTARLCSR